MSKINKGLAVINPKVTATDVYRLINGKWILTEFSYDKKYKEIILYNWVNGKIVPIGIGQYDEK